MPPVMLGVLVVEYGRTWTSATSNEDAERIDWPDTAAVTKAARAKPAAARVLVMSLTSAKNLHDLIQIVHGPGSGLPSLARMKGVGIHVAFWRRRRIRY